MNAPMVEQEEEPNHLQTNMFHVSWAHFTIYTEHNNNNNKYMTIGSKGFCFRRKTDEIMKNHPCGKNIEF